MSPTCPDGHQSSTTDYCDQCGALMVAQLPTATAAEAEADPDTRAAGTGPPVEAAPGLALGEPCPDCRAPRSGDDRFCEDCGYDFSTARSRPLGSEAVAAAWELVVSADRAYFEQMGAEGVKFPDDYPPRRFALERERMRLGRRRPAHGDVPEIDLSGPPEDPAISHVQALLVRRPDGSYEVIDPGSTNGMTLNEDPLPLAANVAVPLADGDRLRFGAWTKVTVRGPGGRAARTDAGR